MKIWRVDQWFWKDANQNGHVQLKIIQIMVRLFVFSDLCFENSNDAWRLKEYDELALSYWLYLSRDGHWKQLFFLSTLQIWFKRKLHNFISTISTKYQATTEKFSLMFIIFFNKHHFIWAYFFCWFSLLQLLCWTLKKIKTLLLISML